MESGDNGILGFPLVLGSECRCGRDGRAAAALSSERDECRIILGRKSPTTAGQPTTTFANWLLNSCRPSFERSSCAGVQP